MTAKRIARKLLKTTGLIVGGFLILVIGFHFWFVYHAEEIIQEIVSVQSGGKIKLEVRNFKFNWFSKKMELEDAEFISTDSASIGTSYRFSVPNIKLKVRAVYPLLFEKKILINNLSLKSPDIVVTQLREVNRDSTRKKEKEDVSIPHEMGKVYKSIQDALNVLKVKKFEIEDAKFTLINKARPEETPLHITHIDFHIDNLQVDTAKFTGKEKIFFSDNIVLKSRDQDIMFPDGRHRLSYRKFRINIEKRIVEFDSCTIAAFRTDSAESDFSVFFDELVLTNIDFDTLYRAEVIRADSVYCNNPQFKLNVDLGKRTGNRKPPPKLDDLIRQLTGDLIINAVVVKNASFDIKTIRDGKPNSFTSTENNFEMKGLLIDKEAERPLKVNKFSMAIRNYENFLRDSTYEMQFDSVLFSDDKIFLADFSFRKILNKRPVYHFRVPRFQLTGLSWDDLLFEQKLKAEKVILYNPIIDYSETANKRSGQKRKLFDILANINEVMELNDLHILNGNIDLKMNGGVSMSLKNATFSIESQSLFSSNKLSGIRRSVNYLDLKKGIFKINDVEVQLDDINYTGEKSQLRAGNAILINKAGNLHAVAKNVNINTVFIDEQTGDVSMEGVNWEKADFKLGALPGNAGNGNGAFISLTDIKGRDTKFNYQFGEQNFSTHIDEIGAVAILLKPGEKPIIGGLRIQGRDLSIRDQSTRFSISNYSLRDLEKAVFTNISIKKESPGSSIDIEIPEISFVPAIQSAINNDLQVKSMIANKPVIKIKTSAKNESSVNSFALRFFNADNISINQPTLYFDKETTNGNFHLEWNGKESASNSIQIQGVKLDSASATIDQLNLDIRNFTIETDKGKKFSAGNGNIKTSLKNLEYHEAPGSGFGWTAVISNLEGNDFELDSVGRKNGHWSIKRLQLRDLDVNSFSMTNMRSLLAANKKFRLDQVTANYADADNRYNIYNASYDKSTQLVNVDSFRYNPTPHKEAFVASRQYQTDYLNVRTGAIQVGPFDIDSYLRDTIIEVGKVKIDNVVFDDFRDNRPPFRAGIIKPLMVDRIKSIPIKIKVDTILLNNTHITYAELSPKTNQTGVIVFSNTDFRIFPFRNFNHGPTDSLRIHANGYLMDSIWIRLRLKQSYVDSMGGFLLTLRMRPADMRVLNPVLLPLASARLKSGYLDTLSMRVAGGEYLAYGEMKLYYHDLKLEILKKGTEKKQGFFSFFANSFLIRNKNKDRLANNFFIRNRERSPLNYLYRILISGVNSAIGVKSNKKLIRKYKKELRQRNLPPVDYD